MITSTDSFSSYPPAGFRQSQTTSSPFGAFGATTSFGAVPSVASPTPPTFAASQPPTFGAAKTFTASSPFKLETQHFQPFGSSAFGVQQQRQQQAQQPPAFVAAAASAPGGAPQASHQRLAMDKTTQVTKEVNEIFQKTPFRFSKQANCSHGGYVLENCNAFSKLALQVGLNANDIFVKYVDFVFVGNLVEEPLSGTISGKELQAFADWLRKQRGKDSAGKAANSKHDITYKTQPVVIERRASLGSPGGSLFSADKQPMSCTTIRSAVTGRDFTMQNVMLSAGSPVFRAMVEGTQGIVTVVDYDEEVIEAALSVIYGAASSVPCDKMMQLYKFADQYRIDTLRSEVRRLADCLAQSSEACAQLYADAVQLSFASLQRNLLRQLCAILAVGELGRHINSWPYPVLDAFYNAVLELKLEARLAAFVGMHLLEAVHSWLSYKPAERYRQCTLDLDLLDFDELSSDERLRALRVLRKVVKSIATAMYGQVAPVMLNIAIK